MPISKILVTGGAGFIGQHLVRALVERGFAVVVLDNLSAGRRNNIPKQVEFIEGDVRDPAACAQALSGVDAVFHLAAVVSVRASVQNFFSDADVNILGTLRLLEAMQRQPGQVRKAVLASSMAVYSDSATASPLSETWATLPASPYGAGKLAAEHYWHLLCAQAGVESTVLRLFNTWGPGQAPSPYVGVLTHFARRLEAAEPLQIFGDGEQRRDFVHVDDVVQASVRVLDHPAAGKTLNVGTGLATSVNEVAHGLIAVFERWREGGRPKTRRASAAQEKPGVKERPGACEGADGQASAPNPMRLQTRDGAIEQLTADAQASAWSPSAEARIQHVPPRPGELRNAIADISAARTVLGYEPRHRLFEEEMDWLFEVKRRV